MNVFTTPSGNMAINLERIVCIQNYCDTGEYIKVMLDVPDQAGGMCELKIWHGDAEAILAAYQDQMEED